MFSWYFLNHRNKRTFKSFSGKYLHCFAISIQRSTEDCSAILKLSECCQLENVNQSKILGLRFMKSPSYEMPGKKAKERSCYQFPIIVYPPFRWDSRCCKHVRKNATFLAKTHGNDLSIQQYATGNFPQKVEVEGHSIPSDPDPAKSVRKAKSERAAVCFDLSFWPHKLSVLHRSLCRMVSCGMCCCYLFNLINIKNVIHKKGANSKFSRTSERIGEFGSFAGNYTWTTIRALKLPILACRR